MLYHRGLRSVCNELDAVRVPLTEDLLFEVLYQSYLIHAPAVAEAIRALEKVGSGHHEWLLSILAGWEEFEELVQAVRQELASECGQEVAAVGNP